MTSVVRLLAFWGQTYMRGLGLLLTGAAIAVMPGCATSSPSSAVQPPAVAIAITTQSDPPSAQQMANISAAMARHITQAGYRVAPSAAVADLIATIRYTPDAAGQGGGHITILSVEPAAEFRQAVAPGSNYDAAKDAARAMRAIQSMADSRARGGEYLPGN